MIYRAIGVMSGSSLDGLDIAFAEFSETGGKWTFNLLEAACEAYDQNWTAKLKDASTLHAKAYLFLHSSYGKYIGDRVNQFIDHYQLQHTVHLIASHGHTSFHFPGHQMTAQLGDGAAIAATTALPVVSDLRSMDIALGGQGAPIVPIGEKLLFPDFSLFLNLGGIANISIKEMDQFIAFDICAANRVLNLLAAEAGHPFDEDGKIAASGTIDAVLLDQLNSQDYYRKPFPKSLDNGFGIDHIYPLIKERALSTPDAIRTYTEHIGLQIKHALQTYPSLSGQKLLVTGGGAFNQFLVERLQSLLAPLGIELNIPDPKLVMYKEALIMALLGVLRWREEANVLSTVTGATRSSIGGALWMGTEC